jgi:hypothetical protein
LGLLKREKILIILCFEELDILSGGLKASPVVEVLSGGPRKRQAFLDTLFYLFISLSTFGNKKCGSTHIGVI